MNDHERLLETIRDAILRVEEAADLADNCEPGIANQIAGAGIALMAARAAVAAHAEAA